MAFTAGAMRPAGLFFGDTLPCFMAATGPLAFFGERFAFIGFRSSPVLVAAHDTRRDEVFQVGPINQLRLDAEHLVLKGFLLEQPSHLLLASGDTQLLRDTPRLDDLADLSASAVLSAG